MIDFHTHILPNIDDGSQSVEMSIQMLRQSAAQGVHTLIATPHYYPHREAPEEFFQRRAVAAKSLMNQWEEIPDSLTMHMGCELHYYDGISRMERLEQCCILGTSTLLLEMPFSPWHSRMYDEILAIGQRGITPVIAHIERYFHLQNKRKMLGILEEIGAYSQVNASYFLGRLGGLQATALFRKGGIQVLGSDCHNLTSRAPDLNDAYQKLLKKFGENEVKAWSQVGRNLLIGAEHIRPSL